MSFEVDSISIKGLRKTHLEQLSEYIHERDREGWYYGDREQFEARHQDLLALADELDRLATDPEIKIASK